MLGLALQVSTFLRRGYGLRKEIDEKQKIELGGASSEYGDQPQVYYSKSYTPQTKRQGTRLP